MVYLQIRMKTSSPRILKISLILNIRSNCNTWTQCLGHIICFVLGIENVTSSRTLYWETSFTWKSSRMFKSVYWKSTLKSGCRGLSAILSMKEMWSSGCQSRLNQWTVKGILSIMLLMTGITCSTKWMIYKGKHKPFLYCCRRTKTARYKVILNINNN